MHPVTPFKQRFFLSGLLVLIVTGGVTPDAVAETPKYGGTVNVIVQPEPPGLNVGLYQNLPTHMIGGNIYEGLIRLSPELQPLPGLADSWVVSEDGKVYTFMISPDAAWHDGVKLTSADVVFSLDKFHRELQPRWRPIAEQYVEKIEAPDDTTVQITLKQPFGPFILMFEVGSTPIMPAHIYDGTDYRTNPKNSVPIGSGPFKFADWNKGSYIRLIKNETYHMKWLPYLDEIYWHIIPDAASRAVAYETGKVDVVTAGSVEFSDIPRLQALPNSCSTGKGWELFAPHSWIWLNNRGGMTAKKEFRQAVMYSIDREFIRDVVWGGYARIASGPISSKTRFHTPDLPKYDYNPDKARGLLKAAGYNGEVIRLLPMPYGETYTRWIEAIRQYLSDVGIRTEMVNTDVAGWNQRLNDWDFDMATTFLYQYGDPAAGVARTYISSNIFKGSPWNNVEGYSNPKVDALFTEAATAFPDSRRQELYTEVEKILIDEVPVAWQLEFEWPTLYSCNVKGLIDSAIGINDAFLDAWKE
jgi:peptide/nickel transport system substrate-binding protein